MIRHGKEDDDPHLFLDGEQPHLYRKSRLKRRELKGRVEEPGEPHLFLDGEQPHIYRRRRVRWTSVLKWGALALVLILVIIVAWGYVWLKMKESKMKVPAVEQVLDSKADDQPVTTLIMGVDTGSVEGEEEGVSRSDIMMLVSVNPANDKAAVISIPRDTRVEIPGESGYEKINAAYALGGPKLAVDTVKEFTGLDINHFVVMDFESFKHIVDAIGGVRMRIEVPINDKYAGKLSAGDQVLNGDQALVLVRARHDPKSVPGGDLDRIKNQRRFLQAMLSTLSHTRNPFRIIRVIDAASENIKTDLTFAEMLRLGRRLQGAGSDLTMTTVPGDSKVVGGIWYYLADTAEFQEMLDGFKTEQKVDPGVEERMQTQQESGGDVKVGVLNGAGVQGLASAVAGELGRSGHVVTVTGNSESRYQRTTVYYAGGQSDKAGAVAADLAGADEPLLEGSDELISKYGVDVLVVLGADYEKP
jgi:LCP family protein required for cell wall assembly